jgi:RimJ/RimL family protein N-acetyltransferase
MTHLETPNLLLRPFETTDFDDVHIYAQDPEVTRYQSWGPNDENDTCEFLRRSKEAFQPPDGDDLEFAIVERASSKVVGGCGIHCRRKAFREYEIGWTLNRSYWRRGFGTEAASVVIDYAFSIANAHRLYALVDAENASSIALSEKLGFVLEGHQHADTLIRGEWRDTLVFARLSPGSRGVIGRGR